MKSCCRRFLAHYFDSFIRCIAECNLIIICCAVQFDSIDILPNAHTRTHNKIKFDHHQRQALKWPSYSIRLNSDEPAAAHFRNLHCINKQTRCVLHNACGPFGTPWIHKNNSFVCSPLETQQTTSRVFARDDDESGAPYPFHSEMQIIVDIQI